MEYVYSEELQHHGILGQKWGVRRYQNKDGTLTRAGKRRAKKLVSDRDSEYFKYYINKLNQDNYKREAYNGTVYNNDDKKLINEEIQSINKLRDKFLNGHLDDKLVVAYTDNFDHKWSEGRPDYLKVDDIDDIEKYGIRDRKAAESATVLDNALSKIKTRDPSNTITSDINSKDWQDSAKLGIKALTSLSMKKYGWSEDTNPENESDRRWFLIEDQTIGQPAVAYLINKGYTSSEVKQFIKDAENVNNAKYVEPKIKNDFVHDFIFTASYGNYKGILEEFADEAQKIYNQEHKKK